MEQFLTWDMLKEYPTFILIVFTFVAFTKNFKIIKKLPTQNYCYSVAFVFRAITMIYFKEFTVINIFLYLLDAVFITLATKGLADKNSQSNFKKEVNTDENKPSD